MSRKKVRDYAGELRAAVNETAARGFLTGVEEIGERAYKAYAPHGWGAAARTVAEQGLGGQVQPGRAGLRWGCGRVRGGNVLDAREQNLLAVTGGYAKGGTYIIGARDVIRGIGGAEAIADVWSVGAAARYLWKFINAGQVSGYSHIQSRGALEHLFPVIDAETLERAPMGHHDCAPGIYPNAALWDVSSYYGSLLRRVADLPGAGLSPYVPPGAGSIDWGVWHDGERERLRDAMIEVWEARTLRNAMWGTALGSYKPIWYWGYDFETRTAVKKKFTPGPGPHRALALLICRTAQDLCAAQSEIIGSAYSTVDSVLSVDGRAPALWQEYGLTVSVRHSGACEVLRRGGWAFWRTAEPKPQEPDSPAWLHRTIPYQNGDTLIVPVARPEQPGNLYAHWLGK